MKVKYVSSHPSSQFVIYATNSEERKQLREFLQLHRNKKWQFWLHGYGGDVYELQEGVGSFNFGWIKKPINKNYKSKLIMSILGMILLVSGYLAGKYK